MKKSSGRTRNLSIDDLLAPSDVSSTRKPFTARKDPAAPAGKPRQSDADFYKSLANDAGDGSDISEADAAAMAKDLQALDNLDDDLFGSLGKKKATPGSKPGTPSGKPPSSGASSHASASKPSTPAAATMPGHGSLSIATTPSPVPAKSADGKPHGARTLTLDEVLLRPDQPAGDSISHGSLRAKESIITKDDDVPPRSSLAAGKPNVTVKKDNSTDFDEDDLLADLLFSDEEDAPASRQSKAKKVLRSVGSAAAESRGMGVLDMAVPAANSAVRADHISFHERPPTRSGSHINSDEDGDDITSTALPVTPRQGKKKIASMLDDTKPDAAPEQPKSKSLLKKSIKKEQEVDFDDDDGLAGLGLDDDDEERGKRMSSAKKGEMGEEIVRPASSFMDSLLGRPSSADKPTQKKDSNLERRSSLGGAASGRNIVTHGEQSHHPPPSNDDDDDDFGFGAYLPSAASTLGLRPASQRSVRFEDEAILEGRPIRSAPEEKASRRQSGLSLTMTGAEEDWLMPAKKQHRPLGLSATMDGAGSSRSADDDWLFLASGNDAEGASSRKAVTKSKPPVSAAKAKSPASSHTQPGTDISLTLQEPNSKKTVIDSAETEQVPRKATASALLARRPSQDDSSHVDNQSADATGKASLWLQGTEAAGEKNEPAASTPVSIGVAYSMSSNIQSASILADDSNLDGGNWAGLKKRINDEDSRKVQQEGDDAGDWLTSTFGSSRRGSVLGSSGTGEVSSVSQPRKSPATHPLTSESETLSAGGNDWLGLASADVAEPAVPKKQTQRSRQSDDDRQKASGSWEASDAAVKSSNNAYGASSAIERQHIPESVTADVTGTGVQRGCSTNIPKPSPTAPSPPWPIQHDFKKQEEQLLKEQDALWQQQQAELQAQLKVQQEQGLSALRRQQELADLRQRQHERVQQQLIEQQRRMQEGVLLVQQQLQAAFDGSTMLLPPGAASHVQNDMVLKQVELEGKVRKLEMEKEHLQTLNEGTKLRHLEEIAALEASYKSRQHLADETFQRRESRLKEENQALAQQSLSRLKQAEEEKAAQVAQHYVRLEELEREKIAEIERIREQNRLAMERLRSDHIGALERLRKAKDDEIEALSNAHSRSNSFQFLVDQMKHNASDLTSLHHRIENQHLNILDERELAARTRDEQLKVLQERLLMQQEENDKERTRLQDLIVKMEVQLREQGRQLQEEQWKLSQEKSKLAALQTSLEEEKRIVTDEVTRERSEMRRAKENLLVEQKQILSQLYEERRALAEERSHFDASQRMLFDREHRDTLRHSQGAAEYEGLMKSVSEESAKLARRSQEVAREEERLSNERAQLELDKDRVSQEREQLSSLALRLKDRSMEVEQMCQAALNAREAGASSLNEAQQIQAAHQHRLVTIQARLQELSTKEKQLAEEQIILAKERNELAQVARTNRCAHCQGRPLHATLPRAASKMSSTFQNPERADQLADLTSISIVRFGLQAERDKDFLEEEHMYLEALKHAPYHVQQKVL